MLNSISRRKFASATALTLGGMLSGLQLKGEFNKRHRNSLAEPLKVFELMSHVKEYRKIDAYANATQKFDQAEAQIRYADRLRIDKLVVSVPIAQTMGGSRDDVRAYNNTIAHAMRAYPGRILGQFIVNPLDRSTALDEIKRCTDLGMVGMKLFNHVKVNHHSVFPVLERFIDHRMIIHVHGESQLGVGGCRMKYNVHNNSAISVPEDFVEVAKRYPEAMFQYAHIGGGSDWEYACKCFLNSPNIYVDTGGSNNEEHMVDYAVDQLGENRVLFGCDSSFYQGIGKTLSSNLTKNQKHKVFFNNYNAILSKSGNSIT